MNPEIEKVKEKATDVANETIKSIKRQSKGFILGLGVGVLLTGPLPGGVVIGIIGIGLILGGALFIKE